MHQRPPEGPKLLELVRRALRLRHYSLRTERAYCDWIRRFILFHGKRHPATLGRVEVQSFLTHLARDLKLSASSQNQALSALLFLYNDVLAIALEKQGPLVRAQRSFRVPVVLTPAEVATLLAHLTGPSMLVARLLYGAGLRLLEALRLRVKDVDFERRELRVREGKGRRDRLAPLPAVVISDLRDWLEAVRAQHERDLLRDAGHVELPYALRRKYPTASRQWPWQWVFPATRLYQDPTTGEWRRHHLHETVVQRAIRESAHRAGLTKRVSGHTLRHSFATHLLETGHDIRTIQELLATATSPPPCSTPTSSTAAPSASAAPSTPSSSSRPPALSALSRPAFHSGITIFLGARDCPAHRHPTLSTSSSLLRAPLPPPNYSWAGQALDELASPSCISATTTIAGVVQ